VNGELAVYRAKLGALIEGLCTVMEGLSEAQLNWRPDVPESNSIYIIASHILGNLEAWALGIACGQAVERDRAAEFRAAGPSAEPLVAQARELSRRIDEALSALAASELDVVREPSAALRGVGPPEPLTVREALMVTFEHGTRHLGHLDLTRDLALESSKG
jgi:uncharacterized damage-inducible protein DinB